MNHVNAPVLREHRRPIAPAGLVQATLRAIKLGDLVHAVARPIARAVGLPCIDPATQQLRPESKCAGRRARWNGGAGTASPQIKVKD